MMQRQLSTFLSICLTLPGLAASEPFAVEHSGFDLFRQGEFGNAGQNLYVSKRGRVQFIHRWDLNDDGNYDLVFSNTHNRNESPDAFIYLQTAHGFRSAMAPLPELLPAYDRWSQQEKSRESLRRLAAVGPGAAAIRDLDGNGWPEIVLANRSNGFDFPAPSYIYWGSAEGHRLRTELPTAMASDVAIGDLNGDGFPDIVFSCQGRGSPAGGGYREHLASYVYWGSKTGYSPDNRTSVRTVLAVSCAVGDLDGDSHPDVVFAEADPEGARLTVYWGGPNGPDFDRPTVLRLAGPRRVRIVEIKPFGVALLAVSDDDVRIYRPGKERELQIIAQAATGGSAAAVGDLDQDGLDEIVVATQDGAKILWGRERFATSRATILPGQYLSDVAIADLDGDGQLDIILASRRTESVYDAQSLIYWGNPRGYGIHRRQELQTFGASSVTVSDTDGDGRLDLLFTNTVSANVGGPDNREDSLVYWGVPHRGYSSAFVARYPTNAAMGSAAVDLDDDGAPELLFANMDDSSFLYRGTPDGPSPQNVQNLTFAGSSPHNSFAVADLNRDGFLDVVMSTGVRVDSGGAVKIMWGGSSGLLSGGSTKIAYDLKGVANIRLVDLNDDGWLDLFLAATYDQRSAILWGSAEGFSMHKATFIDEPYLANVEFADLDQDGMLDMILLKAFDLSAHNIRTGSRVRIRFGHPGGFFVRNPVELPAIGGLDLLVADLNRNGALDVAVAQYNGGTRSDLPFLIFWNGGRGEFDPENRTELPGWGGNGLLAADFDDDGFIDLLGVNHIAEGNHNVDSYIYWGSAQGFSAYERTALPGFGPHWSAHVDIGNIYSRKPEEHYASVPISVPARIERVQISLQGNTPHGSGLAIEARSAPDRNDLKRRPWQRTPNGVAKLLPRETWLQYRVTLRAGRGGATPYLTSVTVREIE